MGGSCKHMLALLIPYDESDCVFFDTPGWSRNVVEYFIFLSWVFPTSRKHALVFFMLKIAPKLICFIWNFLSWGNGIISYKCVSKLGWGYATLISLCSRSCCEKYSSLSKVGCKKKKAEEKYIEKCDPQLEIFNPGARWPKSLASWEKYKLIFFILSFYSFYLKKVILFSKFYFLFLYFYHNYFILKNVILFFKFYFLFLCFYPFNYFILKNVILFFKF